MNGNDIRPITVESKRSLTVFGLLDGARHDLAPGDRLTGFVNEYGNVYTESGSYVGSLGTQFEEVTE